MHRVVGSGVGLVLMVPGQICHETQAEGLSSIANGKGVFWVSSEIFFGRHGRYPGTL